MMKVVPPECKFRLNRQKREKENPSRRSVGHFGHTASWLGEALQGEYRDQSKEAAGDTNG